MACVSLSNKQHSLFVCLSLWVQKITRQQPHHSTYCTFQNLAQHLLHIVFQIKQLNMCFRDLAAVLLGVISYFSGLCNLSSLENLHLVDPKYVHRERGNHNNHDYKWSVECQFDLPQVFPLPPRNHSDMEQHVPLSQPAVFTGTVIKRDLFG